MTEPAGSPANGRGRRAARRLGALSALFDDWTRRHLDHVGLGAGWRCWEVGAGGMAVARWLAERVGPQGCVLATDTDVSRLRAGDGVTVLGHDVGADPPPTCGFDLVHARLALTTVDQRAAALRRMVAALRPGGWLVVEDFDVSGQPLACPDAADDDEERANRVRAGLVEVVAAHGVDLSFGRTLRRRLRALGLADVRAEAYVALAVPAAVALERATVLQVRDALGSIGLADDVRAHLAAIDAGRLDIAVPPLVTAWGRRAT